MMKYFLKRELWFCLHDSGCAITELKKNWTKKNLCFFSIQVMPVQKQKCGAPRYRSPGPILYWQYGCPSWSSLSWFSPPSCVGNMVFQHDQHCHHHRHNHQHPHCHHPVLAIGLSIMFIIRHCHCHRHHHRHHSVLAILVRHHNYQSFGNICCCHCHDFSSGG